MKIILQKAKSAAYSLFCYSSTIHNPQYPGGVEAGRGVRSTDIISQMKPILFLIHIVIISVQLKKVDGAFATVVESGDEDCFQFRAPSNMESAIRCVLTRPLFLITLSIYFVVFALTSSCLLFSNTQW